MGTGIEGGGEAYERDGAPFTRAADIVVVVVYVRDLQRLVVHDEFTAVFARTFGRDQGGQEHDVATASQQSVSCAKKKGKRLGLVVTLSINACAYIHSREFLSKEGQPAPATRSWSQTAMHRMLAASTTAPTAGFATPRKQREATLQASSERTTK